MHHSAFDFSFKCHMDGGNYKDENRVMQFLFPPSQCSLDIQIKPVISY